jgi:hypothetical protein
MSTNSTPAQVDRYLTIRHAQGFNAFYLMAMVHPNGYLPFAPNAPNDRRGNPPFATPGMFSTAAESDASRSYWTWIDTIVDKAAVHHMAVMLAYTYLGFQGEDQGWYHDVLAQPTEASLYRWGVWLGRRFRNKPNVIWFGLGDFTPPAGSAGASRTRAIVDGIKSTGANQLFMAEPSSPDSIPSEVPSFGPVVDQNSFYGYGPDGLGAVYETADRAFAVSPARPAWMQEGTYEYENNTGHFSSEPWDTRRGRFWSVLAGGTAGDGFGSRDVWRWKDIPRSLSTPGARYSTAAFDLFASLPWWRLVPSGTKPGHAGKDLVTSGRGAWGQVDYITSAITSTHDWLLAYAPVTHRGKRSFTVAMSSMSGNTRARWFDPSSGNYLTVSDGYSFDNTGIRRFTTPGSRDDGTDDWLLVLDSTSNPRCGVISTTGLYTAPAARPRGVRCEVTATPRSRPSTISRAPVQFRTRS